MPDMYGSDTFSVAHAATIASIAFPPSIIVFVPASEA
jgi:hypothetical protein